ncbi:MAG: glycosyltransferase [Leptospirales bacterium]|nr:glycosyltransferase [Leptospirales bacterium]
MDTKKYLLVIPAADNRDFFERSLPEIINIRGADILIVDDASDDGSEEIINRINGIVCIRHEQPLGFGASLIRGYEYGRDMGYEILIYLDPRNGNPRADIEQMMAEMNYGYDYVSCSRILENQEAALINPSYMRMTEALSNAVRESLNMDVTDPLSGIFAVRTDALDKMELTDYTHAVMLQLLVQAASLNIACMEIPSASGESFGLEFEEYDDPVGDFLSAMETEKYLYFGENMH